MSDTIKSPAMGNERPIRKLTGVLLAFLAGSVMASLGFAEVRADWLLRGGTVYDGSGGEGWHGDVAILGGEIIFVGDAGAAGIEAKHIIEVPGLAVAPGFIDPHTHALADLQSKKRTQRANAHYLSQGVTTVVVGNDGEGSADVAALGSALQAAGIGPNVAFYVGFGHVRGAVMLQQNQLPSAAEMAAMGDMVGRAMCEGALGFSTGLHYAPQLFAQTEEVATLASVAARYGGLYDTHLRDESSYSIGLLAAVEEAIESGRRSGAPVNIAHIKALGPDVWGFSADVIALIEKARARGQKVTADQYPWRASGTRISDALVPGWALDGGLEGLRGRLNDSDSRRQIADQMAVNLERRGGAGALLITGNLAAAQDHTGKTLQALAEAVGLNPVDAAISLLKEGDARVASFNMHAQDIRAFAVQPWVMTSSDGTPGHPRKYGTFPRAYQDLVRESGTMTTAAFVRRSSGFTADTLGLVGRGYLKPGYAADVVVFDPQLFAAGATYHAPEVHAAGVVHLFVNGEVAIQNSEATWRLNGRPLLRQLNGAVAGCAE